MRNYSQNNEQEIILNYFGDFKGWFMDIGAYNGIDLSNTRALLELGWDGILIEPNPYNLVPLMDSIGAFKNQVSIIAAGACGGTISKMLPLRLDQSPGRGWAASFSDGPGRVEESQLNLMVPLLRVDTIFSAAKRPVQFISIDAEYMDFEILKAIPRQAIEDCRMLVIEAVERDAIRDYLTGTCGFKIHAETPENIIAAR